MIFPPEKLVFKQENTFSSEIVLSNVNEKNGLVEKFRKLISYFRRVYRRFI